MSSERFRTDAASEMAAVVQKRISRQPRIKCVIALAHCIDSLCLGSLMDASGAIKGAIAADDRVWEHLEDSTIEILDDALGIRP